MLIMYKTPRPQHDTSDDYSAYKAIVAQTSVRAYPNKRTGSASPRSTWKWKHMLKGMVIPGDVVEEGDSTDDSSAPTLGELMHSRTAARAPHLRRTPPPQPVQTCRRTRSFYRKR